MKARREKQERYDAKMIREEEEEIRRMQPKKAVITTVPGRLPM